MAFAGNLGARLFLAQVPGVDSLGDSPKATAVLLFSESNTRFLCEVHPENTGAFEACLAGIPHAVVGEVVDTDRLEIVGLPGPVPNADPDEPDEIAAPLVVSSDLATLKAAWQGGLGFDV
jgi:phosphoribosylformylglycinamidine synthase